MSQKIPKKKFIQQVEAYLESNSRGAIVTKILLGVVAVGGIVCAGAVVPNIARAIEGTRRFQLSGRALGRRSVFSAFSKIKKNGYVLLKEGKDGKVTVLLTEKGKRYVWNFTRRLNIPKPIIWDGKWRVVVFDIPTKKRRFHDIFRSKIKEMGFLQFQKSVWVYPYRCEDEILFLAKQLEIVDSIEIFTVEKMIHEKELKNRFFKKKDR